MGVNAEVQKSGSETALSTIRKFSRRVQGTGLIKTMRDRRYFTRRSSKIVKKKRALKLLKRRAEYKQLVKEGKIAEAPVRGRHAGKEQSRPSEGAPIAR
jgi:ribosomal protein S21